MWAEAAVITGDLLLYDALIAGFLPETADIGCLNRHGEYI